MTRRKVHETIAADNHGRGLFLLAEHRFELDDGGLTHWVSGVERARVELPHVADYLAAWPEAAAALV